MQSEVSVSTIPLLQTSQEARSLKKNATALVIRSDGSSRSDTPGFIRASLGVMISLLVAGVTFANVEGGLLWTSAC